MKAKQQIIKGLLHGIFIPLAFICLTFIVGLIWFILLKYIDFLLGVFPENIPLTITVFCGTVSTIIFGGSLYVSSREI